MSVGYWWPVLTWMFAGCAGSSDAIAMHNTIGRALTLIDAELVTEYHDARVEADLRYPPGELGYAAAMAPLNARADALDLAWREHGLMHIALQLDEDTGNERLWREAGACLADALDNLARQLAQRWRHELAAVGSAIRGMAGAACPRSVGGR